MDAQRRAEIAVALIISHVTKHGMRMVPSSEMQKEINVLSQELEVETQCLEILIIQLLETLRVRSFMHNFGLEAYRQAYDQLILAAKNHELGVKCIKHLLKKHGFHLKENNRELGQIAKDAMIEPRLLKTFLKPIAHELIDEMLS